jgi:hypothetical protein
MGGPTPAIFLVNFLCIDARGIGEIRLAVNRAL